MANPDLSETAEWFTHGAVAILESMAESVLITWPHDKMFTRDEILALLRTTKATVLLSGDDMQKADTILRMLGIHPGRTGIKDNG